MLDLFKNYLFEYIFIFVINYLSNSQIISTFLYFIHHFEKQFNYLNQEMMRKFSSPSNLPVSKGHLFLL